MGANGEHTTIYYPTHSRPHRTLIRPQPYRRDPKAHPNLKLKRDDMNSTRLSISEAQSAIPASSSDSATRSEKKHSSSSVSQLFPVDLSEFQAVNQMWAKQGRSQRGLELISGDLVGLKDKQEQASMLAHRHQDPTSFASVSVSVRSATAAFVSMSPCTTTASTSYASSLPSTLFSSAASSSSTSSASTVTVICRSSPWPCPNVTAGNKCLDTCCNPQCDPMQSRLSPKLERNPSSQLSLGHLQPRSLLSPPSPQPIHRTSAIRTPVASSASPLHVLLDEARKDGICSAELAAKETLNAKARLKTHNTGRLRARSLSVPAEVDDELRRSGTASGPSTSASAPPSPRIPARTSTLLDSLVSFAIKLPLSYEVYPDTNASTSTTSPTKESYPLLPLHPSRIYTLKFPPPLPQPRSPFRARSPPRHPTPRFRLVENKEYLRLKAVWNRLSGADGVAVDLFVDTVHDDYCDGDDDDDGDRDDEEDDTSGIRLRDLDCGCESEEECDHLYEEEDGSSSSSRGRISRSRIRRRIMHHHPLPSQSLVDKQGNLHTGCELVVGIAIDGIKESALGLRVDQQQQQQRRARGSAKGKEKEKEKAKKTQTQAKSSSALSSKKLDSLDGLSLTSLVLSPSLSLSSLSHSVRRKLDSFRALGEEHARRVGASTRATQTTNASGYTSTSAQGEDRGTVQLADQAHQDRVQAHAHGRVEDPHHRSVSMLGPEGL